VFGHLPSVQVVALAVSSSLMETIFPGLGALKLVFLGENYAPMLIARFPLTPGSPPPLYPPLGGPKALDLSVVRVLNYKSSGGEEKNRRTISSPIQISMETGAMLSNFFVPTQVQILWW